MRVGSRLRPWSAMSRNVGGSGDRGAQGTVPSAKTVETLTLSKFVFEALHLEST